ncbi:OLC1v1030322C1 [Oldenlandia corymbosa var. corymbosa]|uniref:Fatty acyl-CoA reductase n=1 Tax=Oldenlandia corymbosa var. corymbosa TaxID=529605 RepID=A0AAV1CJ83_OLDCO|nr:OLC1v1030322C1 [Oldenlandia corymbosa var. corymbosa]
MNFSCSFLLIIILGSFAVFIEKLLRVQPNIKKLYLLLRAASHESALQRFYSEIKAKDLFRVLKKKHGPNFSALIAQKITVVHGDISRVNLGVEDLNLFEEMRNEVDIVVNLAATTSFDERYDVSFHINTMWPKHILNFAKRCARIKVLLHVSTAYVSGEKEGLIEETPHRMGDTLNGTVGLDIDNEQKIIDEKLKRLQADNVSKRDLNLAMKDLGLQRARNYGWPNTYVFTKAMGEMILEELKGNIPTVIVRPTIITSTYKQPFPGWNEGLRTIDSIAAGYAKGKITCFLCDPKTVLDIIPADMVVNAMIVAMLAHAQNPSKTPIYQIGSSVSNPLLFSSLQDYIQRYFRKHPCFDKQEKPIQVREVTIFRTRNNFRLYMALRYLVPLKVLWILNAALFQWLGGLYHNLNRKIKYAMRMIDLYAPYLFFKGIYDDTNTEVLRQIVRKNEAENVFYLDPKRINWENYFMNIHFPGLVKYTIK